MEAAFSSVSVNSVIKKREYGRQVSGLAVSRRNSNPGRMIIDRRNPPPALGGATDSVYSDYKTRKQNNPIKPLPTADCDSPSPDQVDVTVRLRIRAARSAYYTKKKSLPPDLTRRWPNGRQWGAIERTSPPSISSGNTFRR